MYNSRLTIGSKARESGLFRSSLGNTTPRYNSEVVGQRRKYMQSSTRNSEEVPEWMSRTQTFHLKQNNKNRSLYANIHSPFNQINQTYVYARQQKVANCQGQFDKVIKNRPRNRWELKDHTYRFQWPKDQIRLKKTQISQSNSLHSRPSSRQNQTMRFYLPKYGIKQTPLHCQKQTPIKIGHPYTLNSTYIK